MHFLIYIPEGRDAADLAHVGLSDLAQGAFARWMDRGTPDGGRGVMFGWAVEGAMGPIKFMPEDQEWIPAAPFQGMPAGRYLVGFWKANPPTPGELRRPRFYGGHNVSLGDGNEWQVPDCLRLPHSYVVGDDGHWRLKVANGFEDIVREAKAWELQGSIPGVEFPVVAALEFVLKSLSLNHRLTREVVSHLQLLNDSGTLRDCFAASLGAGGEPCPTR